MSGAIVVRMETQGVRLNETIDGAAYTGQRYELLLFPQRGGEISVPATTVDIEISQWGGNTQKQAVQKTAPALTFTARTPPGAEKIRGLISTQRLSADQTWQPDTSDFSVGDTLERRITFSADNVSAMAFTPLMFESAEAFAVYPKPPEVVDRYDLTARRVESVTYVFKRAGQMEIPAVIITCWDLNREALQETVLSSHTLNVAPSAAAQGARSTAIGDVTPNSRMWIYGVAIILLATVLAILFGKPLQRRWRTWRSQRQQSEKAFFGRFVNAARKGNPAEALGALMRWLDRIHDGEQAARLDRFVQSFSNDQGKNAADALIRAADSRAPVTWQGGDLVNLMTHARRRWMDRRQSLEKGSHLPLFNPQ